MKIIFFSVILFSSFSTVAQLHSGTPVIHTKPQPVPNSSTAEKSAPPQPINIPPAANPVKPIYPGGEVKAVEIPRQLINPPVTPSGTQPIQKEPLSPIESTNTLQPNRPPRDRTSRENNRAVSSPIIPNRSVLNQNNTLSSNRTNVTSRNNTPSSTARRSTTAKASTYKKVATKKKPRQ